MSDRPPEAVLWDFARGTTMTRALGVAVDTGIPGLLARGPRSVQDIARQAGVHPDALHRLLRALASDGVFAEDEEGIFRNTDASERLRGEGWGDFAHLFGGVFYRAVADLDKAVETNEATFPDSFGTDFWSWLATEPGDRAAFDRAMAGGKDGDAARLAELDWTDDEVVVDVGGGNGALLLALLHLRPELRGLVVDLPETKRDESKLGDRIEFGPGDFFEHVPSGDAYILSTVLHDWDDEHAAKILRVVRASAPAHARLVVIDSVVSAGNDSQGSKWLDLLLLVLLSGRERTEQQWHALLNASGFEIQHIEDGLIQARCL